MSAKTKETKYIKVTFGYDETFILPQQTASKLMALLEEGETILKANWDFDDATIVPEVKFKMEPIAANDIQMIKKAQLAGITYKEYKTILEEKDNDDDQGSTAS